MKLINFSLLALVVESVVCYRAVNASLTVTTSSGTFKGFIDPAYPNTQQWRAIPFAEPPVASRRWLPPQPVSSASPEPRYSTKFPPSCPQFVSAAENFWSLPLSRGNLIYNGAQNDTSGLVGEATSEDCLYLAVWVPTTPPPAGGFPVQFFMTGGGFIIGGVDLPWQNPTPWVERSQSAIVVSINYRVNIFGFPNARGLADGEQNLGILDQRLALEWTRDNIAAFGGNPERIMHWGRSAGAISADIHAFAYHDDPIAQSYFLESGVITDGAALVGEKIGFSNFTFVAQNVGCGSPCGGNCSVVEEAKAELDCMRLVSFQQISNFVGQYTDAGSSNGSISFPPLADDRLIFSDLQARADAGLIARRPAMISTTANEFSSLTAWPKDNLTEGPWFPPVLAADITWNCGVYNATINRNQLGEGEAPVYRFQYAAEFPNLNVYDWLGAYHNSETPLIFGQYHLLDHVANSTEFQKELSETMQDYIMAFVEDPYNGPQEKFGWRPLVVSEENGGQILRFGASNIAVQYVDGVEIDGVCEGIGEYDPFPS